VKNIINNTSEITSQNHGFGVDGDSLKSLSNVEVTHINLNDETIEGIRIKGKKAFSVQYHPESSPGPHDSAYLFDEFLAIL
jgi:carbamoyl-phosphate synthase small subunit